MPAQIAGRSSLQGNRQYQPSTLVSVATPVLSRLVRQASSPLAWTWWNGTVETPLTLDGVWNGVSIVPIVSQGFAP